MVCPCRLASGSREDDGDIICPCAYREMDVRDYGSCYCNLYVSREWNEGGAHHPYVPERRPPEKLGLPLSMVTRGDMTTARPHAMRAHFRPSLRVVSICESVYARFPGQAPSSFQGLGVLRGRGNSRKALMCGTGRDIMGANGRW